MTESRQVRRQRERQEKRDTKPVREGLTAGQLKEAEAELADGVVEYESARATTLAVLAHSWYALDHQREASRMAYQRIIELRKGGRELKTDNIVQQYAEAKAEIAVVEAQMVGVLSTIADEEGEEMTIALLKAPQMDMTSGIGVRLPEALRNRLAREAELTEPDLVEGAGTGAPGENEYPVD